MTRMAVKAFVFGMFLLAPVATGYATDESRYISLDEIKPDMTGYALSVYSGTTIEKFPIKVISVVRDYSPGKDAIFVMGTGEKFKHTGPVQGCSGSPVYIEGRIAGALAFGWGFVKDPLYGVTPIGEMLAIDERKERLEASGLAALDIDYRKIDFKAVCERISSMLSSSTAAAPTGLRQLEVPVVSSLSADICGKIDALCGLRVFSGSSSGQSINPAPGSCTPNFEPGSVISIPMLDGDIKMAAIGTLTDIVGDKVYAFGHAFDAGGKVELPMATGIIHMVVANQISSFKFGQSGQTVGAITLDTATGIYGQIGRQAPLIPLNITVNRSDNPDTTVYRCKSAVHDLYTPYMIMAAIAGASLSQGEVPIEHTIKYNARIGIKGYEDITFERVTSDENIAPPIFETAGLAAMLMNNRFHKAELTGIDFSIDIYDTDSTAALTYVTIDKERVESGQKVNLAVVTEKLYSQKEIAAIEFEIPEDITPGRYQIMIGGGDFYNKFISAMRPYSNMADDFETMLNMIKNELAADKTGVYAVMRTTNDGVSIGKAPLEGLPLSKMASLASPKRNYAVMPISKWVEKKVKTTTIVSGEYQINIIVK